MSPVQVAADVLGVPLSENGSNTAAAVVLDWGGRKVEYKVSVYSDVSEENLYCGIVKFPGYVRGYLVVDRRGSAEVVRLHLYDGSRTRVADVQCRNLDATLLAIAPYVASSYELGPSNEWLPVITELRA